MCGLAWSQHCAGNAWRARSKTQERNYQIRSLYVIKIINLQTTMLFKTQNQRKDTKNPLKISCKDIHSRNDAIQCHTKWWTGSSESGVSNGYLYGGVLGLVSVNVQRCSLLFDALRCFLVHYFLSHVSLIISSLLILIAHISSYSFPSLNHLSPLRPLFNP